MSMIKIITEENWLKYLMKSKNLTIYHHPLFMNNHNEKINYTCYFKGDEPILGIPLVEERKNRLRFQAYNGFIFSDRKSTKLQKIISSNVKAFKKYSEHIYKNYDEIEISCDDTLLDVRPFLWHNYPNGSYSTDDYFTSKISLKNFSREMISEARRQEIKKSQNIGLKISSSNNFKSAANFFYGDQKNEDSVDDEKICLKIMQSLNENKLGELFSCHLKKEIISYAFFGTFKNKVYYMFAGANKKFKDIPYHTLIIYNSIIQFKKNFSEIDFVGVNSPERGSFKLSFGGDLNRCIKLKMKKKKHEIKFS
jgi:hypothetical protein